MDSEDRHDFEETLGTFSHCRYEVVLTGEVFDGAEALRGFYAETHRAFPDFRFEGGRFHHCEAGVIVETTFVATHAGPWRGLPATGRPVRYAMCNVFEFEDDRLVCERLYFDLQGVLQQVGIARDPTSLAGRLGAVLNHPITILGALLRGGRRAKGADQANPRMGEAL